MAQLKQVGPALAVAAGAAPRRVLILSTDIGGGHDALARALRDEIVTSFPGTLVQVENGFRIGNPLMHRLGRDGYKAQLDVLPSGYTAYYHATGWSPVTDGVRWIAWAGMQRALARHIDEYRPDVVVSTFPMITGALGRMRLKGSLNVPAVGAVIDSNPHPLWLARGIDRHMVFNPADVARIQRHADEGVRALSVRPAVDPRALLPHDRAAARQLFGLPADRPVLLVSGGSWGLSIPEREIRSIIERTNAFVVVACGRNDELARSLAATFPADRLKAVKFTDDMPSLIASADVALVNSGGMTTYESFALGTPVVLYQPIAGHGIGGARALHEDGLATFARSQDELVGFLRDMAAGRGDAATRAAAARGLFTAQAPMSDAVMGMVLLAPASA